MNADFVNSKTTSPVEIKPGMKLIHFEQTQQEPLVIAYLSEKSYPDADSAFRPFQQWT